ncbi:uncharacterized protein LOC119449087 [Dermacentor silvarum]|uniref:uncharacterized protein LOC119449087 n=1 Tax=Dermacentor silvarum TaxID=543639 RepID=UPI002100DB7A|nr:uncharacterized protein LOC119449087 [Dermacentor silvarum]
MARPLFCLPSNDFAPSNFQEYQRANELDAARDLARMAYFAKRRLSSLECCEKWCSHFFDPRDFNEQLMSAVCSKAPSQEKKATSKLESLLNHVQRQFQAKLPVVPSGLQPLHSAIGGAGLAILLRCTGTQSTVCHLEGHLEQINDVIWLLDFEMTEVMPGKHAIRRVGESEFLKIYEDDVVFAYAALTLLLLLHTHSCIERFEVVDMFAAETGFDRMLCANIGASDSLTCFRMSRCELSESASHMLGKALGHLLSANLRELSLDLLALSGEKDVWMDPLAEGVATAQNLAMLRITDLYINMDYGKSRLDTGRALLGALKVNAAIACLSVDCSFVSLGHGPRFKEWLAQASALKELSLCCSQCRHRHEASLVFESLPATTGIARLDFQGFALRATDAASLTELLAGSDRLDDVSFTFGKRAHRQSDKYNERMLQYEESAGTWVVEALVVALSRTTSLRRLAVMGGFSARDTRRLLQAAHDCASLEELTCESFTFGRTHFNRGKVLLPRAAHVVTVRRCEPRVEHMQPLVDTWKELVAERALRPLGFLHSSSVDLCLALTENCADRAVALSLDLQGGVTPELARLLAAYLASTRSLRMLSVTMPCWDRLEHAIVEGLVQNSSIEELHLDNFALDDRDTAALGRWLSGNRRLHTLSIRLEASRYGTRMDPPGTTTLLLTLAASLDENYALTCIHVDSYWAHMPAWYFIARTIRRNSGLLHNAAAFVLGSELRRAAIAFELVHWHPLLADIVQRTGSLSQDEAKKRIRESVQRICHEFWRLVGIVRQEKVVGNKSETISSAQDLNAEQLQLGQLGDDVLRRIRSFLRIGDVVDTRTEGPAETLTPEEITAGVVKAAASFLSTRSQK